MKRWIHASADVNPVLKRLADKAQELIQNQIDDPIEFGELKFDRDRFSFRVIDMDQGYWDGIFEFKMPEDGDIYDQLEEEVSQFIEDIDDEI